jgi:hypothetical protein
VRDVIEAIGSNPVGAVLILLELLTRNAECVGQLLLRHAEQQSAHPHAGADMRVDGVGGSVREHENLCRSGDGVGHRIHLMCVATPFCIADSPRNHFFNASIRGRRNLDGKLKGCSFVKAEQSRYGRMTMRCNFALLVTMLSV